MKRILLLTLTSLICGCGKNDTPSAQTVTPASETPQPAPVATVEQQEPTFHYEELLAAAEKKLSEKDARQAIQILTQAIRQDPKDSRAYVQRGMILAEAKLLPQAISDLTSAIKLDSDNPKLLNTRGYYLLLQQNLNAAEQDFNDAIGLDLNYPQPYNNRGLVWISRGDFEAAVKEFDHALAIKSDYIDAHNNRGFALMQLQRLEEAAECFTRALEINPDYINSLSNRGRTYLQLGEYEEAIQDFTRAIELQPANLQYYAQRAEAYQGNGQIAEATADIHHVAWVRTLSELDQQVARTPRNADLWVTRARHLLLDSRWEEALKSYTNALNVNPHHTDALLGQALIYSRQEDHEQVVACCNRILEKTPLREARSLRADAHLELGQLDEAIADYDACRRFDSRVAEAYRKRADQRRMAGEEDLAKADEEFAATLERQLTENVAVESSARPRAMVIEQASYEEVVEESNESN